MNLSRRVLFHKKSTVCLKYFGQDCRYLVFVRLSGSYRLRFSLEKLIERAVIFSAFEYCCISNSDTSYARQSFSPKISLLDIMLLPSYTYVSDMCVLSNFENLQNLYRHWRLNMDAVPGLMIDKQYLLSCRVSLPVKVSTKQSKLSNATPVACSE